MKFICNAPGCGGDICTLDAIPIDFDPECCPFNGSKNAQWKKVEETPTNHDELDNEQTN